MPYFAYNVGWWVQKEGKFCLRNKVQIEIFKNSMPLFESELISK